MSAVAYMGHGSLPIERKGDWIETYTGRSFYPLDPRVSDVHIDDIAHALSMLCRFGGHTEYFYSVAEHSVNVAECLYAWYNDPKLALKGLLHDGSEGYLVDMPSPIKPYVTNYKTLERGVQDAVYTRFTGIPTEGDEISIKGADTFMLYVEASQLMRKKATTYTLYSEYKDRISEYPHLECLVPALAKERFMLTYEKFKL